MKNIFKEIEKINKEIAILNARRNSLEVGYMLENNIDYKEFEHRYIQTVNPEFYKSGGGTS